MAAPVPLSDPTTQLCLPAGFRFNPTDEELMVQYLYRKVSGEHSPLLIIGDVDLYKFPPWELPSMAIFGEKEWYFFSPRDRKYPNGNRPNRVVGSGYWKATGTDKKIMSGKVKLGVKKSLVFYVGKAPKGSKTNWIMHEYRLTEPSSKDNNTLRLDDWVLCRIYKKKSCAEKTVSGGPNTEKVPDSPPSPSSRSVNHFDSIPAPLPAVDKFANSPNNHPVTTLNEEDQNIYIPKIDSENYEWMSGGAFAIPEPINGNNHLYSPAVDPTFNMTMEFFELPDGEVPNGIRSQRVENSGYVTGPGFLNTDPFAIRVRYGESKTEK